MKAEAVQPERIAVPAGTRSVAGLGRRTQTLLVDVVVWAGLLVGSIIFILPFFWMVSSSFKEFGGLFNFPPTFIPSTWQWTNYLEIWRRLPFHLFFRNSFFVSSLETAGVCSPRP